MKRNFSDQTDLKWYDLYSPETNSFIRISTKQTAEQDGSVDGLYDSLLDLMKYLTRQSDLQQSLELALQQFLRNMSPTCQTSLFLVRNLNSQMCNYLNYIDNFKQVYQMQCGDMKELSDTDRSFAQLGLFPITNSYQCESSEDRAACDLMMSFNQETANDSKFKNLGQSKLNLIKKN